MTELDNILSIKQGVSDRLRNARKSIKMSQCVLSQRSGVSLGSIKRFERTGEIALSSLLKLAMVLGYENDFNNLFTRKNYQSIFDVIKDGGSDAK